MTALTEFVRARIADDRAIARTAAYMNVPPVYADQRPAPEWEFSESQSSTWDIRTVAEFGTEQYQYKEAITMDREGLSDSVDHNAGPHIARHDPARVLRQCDAFEAVIDAAESDAEAIEGEWGIGRSPEQREAMGDAPRAILALATIWSDHEDYRQEWAA